MEEKSIGRHAAAGMSWQLYEKFGVAIIQFAINTMLARMVLPSEYSIVSLIIVFITFSDLLINAGLGTAIIQRPKISDTDASSVFWTSLALSVVIYVLLYFAAPLIAGFYDKFDSELLVAVLRAYSFMIIPTAANGVFRSLMQKRLQFSRMFLGSIIPMVISGTLGVVMVYRGFGVWSLVCYAVLNAVLGTVLLVFIAGWRPRFVYRWSSVRSMLSYSWKLLTANLIDTSYKNLYPLIIGKVFDTATLGLYTYGRQIPSFLVASIGSATTTVMFPLYAKAQDDKQQLLSEVRRTIQLSNFLIFPLMAGIIATARAVILILLTEKWLGSAFYLQMFCVVYGLYHLQTLSFQAISATGHSEVFLKYEVVKKLLGVVVLAVTMFISMDALVWGQVILAVVYVLVNLRPNRQWLGYTPAQLLSDTLPSLLLSVAMAAAVMALGALLSAYNIYVVTALQVVCGVALYIAGAKLLHIKAMDDLLVLVRHYLKRS